MNCTIKSKKLNRAITFHKFDFYIYVDTNGQPGSMGNQICHGGSFSGSTIGYSGSSQEEFEAICRRWYKAYMKKIF